MTTRPARPRTLPLALLALAAPSAVAVALGGSESGVRVDEPVDFFRDVRPILGDHCFQCHGADEATREGDLRLDVKEELFADRGGYHTVVPGDAGASELLLRVLDDVDPRPPAGEGVPLTDEEKDVLRRWIEQGAEWSEHWAFVAPSKRDAPAVSDATWARDDLDRFVLARIEAAGLTPAAEATREAWLRRVTFDLTGLPPTADELDAFLADEGDGAYERQVDRLLASPRYGERQAQDWLDLARYADSNGNQFDEPREMWSWRDWVIEAFNENMPYDQFVVEQLAGDLLPDPTSSQLVATGFNRNNPTDTDGPSEKDEYRTEYVIDRVHTTATTFLGLTMACAQCHDHKYDPISQAEYYSFYGFFNDVAEADIDFGNPRPRMYVPNPDQAPLLADLDERIAELEDRIEAPDGYLDRQQLDWEEETRARLGEPVAWTPLEPIGMISHNGARLSLQDDGSILATGNTPVRDTYDLVIQPGSGTIEALRLEVLPSPEREDGATGRSEDGTFNLSALEIRDVTLSDSERPPLVYVALGQADLRQPRPDGVDTEEGAARAGEFEDALVYEGADDEDDGDDFFGRGGWTIVGPERTRAHDAVVIPLEPLQLNDVSVLKIRMAQSQGGKARSTIARFRWSVTDDPRLRSQLLPVAPKLWHTVGPWPATDGRSAFDTPYGPELALAEGLDLKAKFPLPEPLEEEGEGQGGPGPGGFGQAGFGPGGPDAGGDAPDAAGEDTAAPPEADGARDADDTSDDGPRPEATAVEPADGAGPPDAAREERDESSEDAPADGRAPADDAAAAPEAADGAAFLVAGEDGVAVVAVADGEEPEVEEFDFEEFDFFSGRGRRNRDLRWEEQRGWSDGERQSLEVETGAVYLARTIECEVASTARLRLDGPAGVKVWLNGELVFEEAPPVPEPPRERGRGDDDDDDFDFFAFFGGGGRGNDRGDRETRVGLRAGTNELLVKAVYEAPPQREGRRGGGGFGGFGRRNRGSSVTFDLVPEGEHVLDYEVAQAVRRRGLAESLTAATDADAEDRVAEEGTPAPAGMTAPMGVDTIQAAPHVQTPEAHAALRLRDHYRENVSPIGRAYHTELERLQDERSELVRGMPETMVMTDREEGRKPYVFIRGDWRLPGPEVDTGTPAALPPLPDDQPRNRLGLANWIVAPDNPLTARVAVNRAWQQLFGVGFVATAEDFGVRAETPTHPELLDTLAVEFVESGWDLKAMHKRLVLSATYRQAAAATPEKLEADPDNRMLTRGPRARLSAEMIRDNALFLAGLLNEEIGGESVMPYQAEGIWEEIFGGGGWRRTRGEDQYRRGLYVYWKRRAPYPSMVTFDASKGDTCVVQRPETNTPNQALVLLNNPVYVEAAKMLGQRLLETEGDDAAKLALGFRLCTSRDPGEDEIAVLTELLTALREQYAADAEAAGELLGVGDAKVDEAHDAAELAAWAQLASALLNLDATIHKG